MTFRGHQFGAVLGAAIVVGCQSGPDPASSSASSPPDGKAAARSPTEPEGARAITIDWASAGDCRAQLRRLLEVADDGPLPDPEDVPFAVVVQPSAAEPGWLTPRASYLRTDLPIPVYRPGDPKASSAPCLIEVGPAHAIDAQEQALATEKVRSAYQTGTRSENNPKYDVAKARVRQAERRVKDARSGVLEVGDPLLDLVGMLVGGVITGLDQVSEEEALDRALAELARTPRKIDKPKYRAYHFERTTVRAGKTAVIPVSLVDRRRERTWRVDLRQRELREFHLLDGLDPRDRQYEQHREGSMTRAELDRWAREAPVIDLSTALAALLEPSSEAASGTVASRPRDGRPDAGDAGPTAERAASPTGEDEAADTLRRIKGPRPAARDRPLRLAADDRPVAGEPERIPAASGPHDEVDRLDSVVEVTAADQKGSGVYVARHLVLTSYRLVQGATLIDVHTADGETVAGLLADADPGRDLALVQVPRPGAPLGWRAGAHLPPSSLVEVLTSEGAVTARIAPERGAMRVRIEGARPSGPFGAPVVLGAEAVAIVTALGDAGGRTLQAASADEIVRFLERGTGPLAAN